MTKGWPLGGAVPAGLQPCRAAGKGRQARPRRLLSALLPRSPAFLRPLRHLPALPLFSSIFALVRRFIQSLSLSFIPSFPSFPLPFAFWVVFNFFRFAFLFLFACRSFFFCLSVFRYFPTSPHLEPVFPSIPARATGGPRLAGWAQPRGFPGGCLGKQNPGTPPARGVLGWGVLEWAGGASRLSWQYRGDGTAARHAREDQDKGDTPGHGCTACSEGLHPQRARLVPGPRALGSTGERWGRSSPGMCRKAVPTHGLPSVRHRGCAWLSRSLARKRSQSRSCARPELTAEREPRT